MKFYYKKRRVYTLTYQIKYTIIYHMRQTTAINKRPQYCQGQLGRRCSPALGWVKSWQQILNVSDFGGQSDSACYIFEGEEKEPPRFAIFEILVTSEKFEKTF